MDILPPGEGSRVFYIDGSGSEAFSEHHARWQRTSAQKTSRAVFSAFCDAVSSGKDRFTGGAPQLVGIHRKGPAKVFGIAWGKKRFFYGSELVYRTKCQNETSWFNGLFEICDPDALKLQPGAQPQPRPNEVR